MVLQVNGALITPVPAPKRLILQIHGIIRRLFQSPKPCGSYRNRSWHGEFDWAVAAQEDFGQQLTKTPSSWNQTGPSNLRSRRTSADAANCAKGSLDRLSLAFPLLALSLHP